jgi:hypothetical protein
MSALTLSGLLLFEGSMDFERLTRGGVLCPRLTVLSANLYRRKPGTCPCSSCKDAAHRTLPLAACNYRMPIFIGTRSNTSVQPSPGMKQVITNLGRALCFPLGTGDRYSRIHFGDRGRRAVARRRRFILVMLGNGGWRRVVGRLWWPIYLR